uniref:Nanos-type domain-containing protein n=1 Tax=Heterorhabditis bacteriophora TaxID=37862 RepID=A0A1I7XTT9_HETBA
MAPQLMNHYNKSITHPGPADREQLNLYNPIGYRPANAMPGIYNDGPQYMRQRAYSAIETTRQPFLTPPLTAFEASKRRRTQSMLVENKMMNGTNQRVTCNKPDGFLFRRTRSYREKPGKVNRTSNKVNRTLDVFDHSINEECGYCTSMDMPSFGHNRQNCPALASLDPCTKCGAFGEDNHTATYCPFQKTTKLELRKEFEDQLQRSQKRREEMRKKLMKSTEEQMNVGDVISSLCEQLHIFPRF